jgi:hypothetical protein
MHFCKFRAAFLVSATVAFAAYVPGGLKSASDEDPRQPTTDCAEGDPRPETGQSIFHPLLLITTRWVMSALEALAETARVARMGA